MTVKEIIKSLDADVVAGTAGLGNEIRGGYVSDLLSDVMANAVAGDVWVTLQAHPNIIAVASLNELAAIVIVGGRETAEETRKKADELGLPLLVTRKTAFSVVAILAAMGVSGDR